jgi:hypothetical protein
VQRVIQLKPALVYCAKNRQEHRDFDGAGSMEPPVATQRKSRAALKIVYGHCDRARIAFGAQSFHFLIELAGKIGV